MSKHDLNVQDFELSEIESIELVGDIDTVDITVDDVHMFFANDIYSHNSGAKDDIIEGDKAAGSYDKIMIADFAMSLSRKRQDKVNGTGRIHIMKNRYGMDGMSFGATIDTSVGRIKIDNDELDESTLPPPASGSNSNFGAFNQDERDMLSKKFYELGGIS